MQDAVSENANKDTIKVPRNPHMSQDAIKYLERRLSESKCYLEYGAGGSTRLASRIGVPVIYSVESSAEFAKAVRWYVKVHGNSPQARVITTDIGSTDRWGYPSDRSMCQRWINYPMAIWNRMEKEGNSPDLILVDGRFRVACFLTSLIRAKPQTEIIFDDFVGREHRYDVVLKYASNYQVFGRTASFNVPDHIDARSLALDLAKFVFNPH